MKIFVNIKPSIFFIIFISTIFYGCKNEISNSKFEYNRKANELIQQLISEEKCDCIVEIPKETLIELETLEVPNFNSEKYYVEKLSLKSKKEFDSLKKITQDFTLDQIFLKNNKIRIIRRDSLQIMIKNNFNSKICKTGITFFIKPIFNKKFDVAIISYGEVGIHGGIGRKLFEYKDNKWVIKTAGNRL